MDYLLQTFRHCSFDQLKFFAKNTYFAKNAYSTNNSAITLFHNNDVPGDIGIGKYSKKEIHVRTCWDSTCPTQTTSSTPNVDQCIINVD